MKFWGTIFLLSFVFLSSKTFSQSDSTLIFSEIMFYPTSGPNEFIELYNFSGTDSLDLNSYGIKYYTSSEDIIIDAGEGTVLPPKSFAIILEGDYPIGTGIYDNLIPSEALILKISDNAFGSSGMANTASRPLWLLSSGGDTLDAYFYSADNSSSYSDEKTEMIKDSSQTNWGNSTTSNGTPGFKNSITPLSFELEMNSLTFSPSIPTKGDDVTIYAKVKNRGRDEALNYTIEIYNDADFDSTATPGELIYSQSYSNLLPGDSITVNTIMQAISADDYQILSKVIFNEDEYPFNNGLIITFAVFPAGNNFNDIVINEVMYAPVSDEPEWIELVNTSNDSLNLRNWSISDILSSPSKNSITTENFYLQPDEFLIIARDTSFNTFHPDVPCKIFDVNFGSLGNTEDGIIVYNFRDEIIDSLLYNSSWGGKDGYSLERILTDGLTNDEANWTSSLSLNKSTPGLTNSVGEIPVLRRNLFIINEIMFDPAEDNSEFVEFLNLSDDPVNIGGWYIEDENTNSHKLSESSLNVPSDSYFVQAADSLIFHKYSLSSESLVSITNESSLGLINSGELIILKDIRGNVMDSIWYSDKWHNKNFVSTKNISLERINPKLNGNDPSNWSSSADLLGGTPGKRNSIFTDNLNDESNISVSPNPFSPDDDGFEDFTIINYKLKEATSQVRIKIFDSKGRLIRTLVNNMASGSLGSVIFDGRNDYGEVLRIGIYIIFLEAINESRGVVDNMKTVVVVARKL